MHTNKYMEKIPEQKPKNELNEVSSTELMRGIIERERREKIVETAQKIIELAQLEAGTHETDEFGNPTLGATDEERKRLLEEKRVEVKKLEEHIGMTYDQESHLRTADVVAGDSPTSEYLQQYN